MSWEPIGFWGCNRSGYLDLWNNQRTLAYVLKHSPQAMKMRPENFADISSFITSDGPPVSVPSLTTFTNPIDDKAWWFDTARAESGGFLGMIVDRVNGLESNTRQQDNDVLLDYNGTFSYRKPVNKGYTITVEAVLFGMSCCAVAYGFRRLRKALDGCCSDGCRGTRLRLFGNTPGSGFLSAGGWIPPSEASISPWRSLMNVRLLEQPSIVEGSGIACGACGCNPVTRITFTLKSQGEIYKDPVTLLYQQLLQGGDCTLGCSPTCATIPDIVSDPAINIGPLPSAPNAALSVPPAIVSQQWRTIDFQSVGFDSEMEVDIFAGSQPLYGVTVKFWPYNAAIDPSTGIYNDCNMCSGFAVPYVAAGATWHRKVCSGLYVTKPPYNQNARGTLLDTAWQTPNPSMRFGSNRYYVSIETDSSAASDAWITMSGRTVEP